MVLNREKNVPAKRFSHPLFYSMHHLQIFTSTEIGDDNVLIFLID